MPEILTKHPEIVKELLERGGGKCGAGQSQTILKECPPEQFCRVPGGEICVYGVEQAAQMTQVTRGELCAGEAKPGVVSGGCAGCATAQESAIDGGVALTLGLAVIAGAKLRRRSLAGRVRRW